MIKYILLDVSGTILYKPSLYDKLFKVLQSFGFTIDLKTIKYHHKLLSESIKFPDRTDRAFYDNFNSELVFSFGIVPCDEILSAIFSECTYLPWEKFEDTNVLNDLQLPIGILSNFNSSLEEKLSQFFNIAFQDVFVSEVIGCSKPSLEFYKYALEKINLQPNEILYIGDSFKLDYKPAKEIGFTTFIIDRDNFYPKSENIINSLLEIKNII